MKKKILYLHVGWSKTGTSAVQSQIQRQKQDFLNKGILYPQTLQWPDHSHHQFALSFRAQSSGPYQSGITPQVALDKLKKEIDDSSHTDSVLLSSELSPFYFNNSVFNSFVSEYFESVKIIFTVRRQSELLMSLMNQLVKDPNVRFKGTVFQLGMQNISNLNFYQNILLWERKVGKDNIICIPYSKKIVSDFFSIFNVSFIQTSDSEFNKSVPNRVLSGIQSFPLSLSNPDFLKNREKLISYSDSLPVGDDKVNIFSADEQRTYDMYFNKMNANLSGFFLKEAFPEEKKDYLSVSGISPDELGSYLGDN